MIRIAKIVATHGLQGNVILTHILGQAGWLKKEDSVFVEIQKGSFIPFFVKACKVSAFQEYHLQLEEVSTVEQAKKLIGRPVYVNEEVLTQYAKNSPLLWIGCSIVDDHYGPLGPIEDMMQTGVQWIARVIFQQKEVLLPMVEQTILNVDLKKREIKTSLPIGLVEVYL